MVDASTLYASLHTISLVTPLLSVVWAHTLCAFALLLSVTTPPFAMFVPGVHVLLVVVQYLTLDTPLTLFVPSTFILSALYHPLLPAVLLATLTLVVVLLPSTLYASLHTTPLRFPFLSSTSLHIFCAFALLVISITVLPSSTLVLGSHLSSVVTQYFSFDTPLSLSSPFASIFKL